MQPVPYHRHFDHIRRSSLDGRIDGIPFCKTAYRKIGGVNIPQPSFPAHQRLYITVLLGKGYWYLPCKW